ncbi:MAG TPA: amidohydrolase family protein, partial [Polyangiaceae bacterium]|nr:amidohydrolase family protein [Polyangiaceae bacterium]
MSFWIENARVVSGDGSAPLPRAAVRVQGDRIATVTSTPNDDEPTRVDAGGRVLMPGFVDAHTHALWAGDRLDEFEQLQRGRSYVDILAAGGGILSTV